MPEQISEEEAKQTVTGASTRRPVQTESLDQDRSETDRRTASS